MTGLLVCLTTAALGVDYGWQPIAGGGIEYVIQIEPQMLEALKRGDDLSSALPAGAKNIRRYRIVVGDAKLPHHGEPLPVDSGEESAPGQAAASEVSPVAYEESAPADDGPRLSMPLESPYPSDYVKAGIPLPGPVSHSPAVAGPASVKPQLPPDDEMPDAGELVEAAEESESFESRLTSKPPVNLPGEKPARQPPGKLSLNLGSPYSAREPEASKLGAQKPRANAAVKASSATIEEEKKKLAEVDERPSPSDDKDAESTPAAAETNSTALVGLFASLGGNVFLLWVVGGQRSRYRMLLRRSREALSAASLDQLPAPAEHDDGPQWEAVPEEEYEQETD